MCHELWEVRRVAFRQPGRLISGKVSVHAAMNLTRPRLYALALLCPGLLGGCELLVGDLPEAAQARDGGSGVGPGGSSGSAGAGSGGVSGRGGGGASGDA